MPTFDQVIAAHRERIVAEVASVLWHDHPELRGLGRANLDGLVGDLLQALVDRVRLPRHPRLHTVAAEILSAQALSSALLAGALLRLASAARGVLLLELDNRRATHIASAALDRIVAELIEGLPGPETLHPVSTPTVVEPRDPTMVRNIRELLAEAKDEQVLASLVGIRWRDPPTPEVPPPDLPAPAAALRQGRALFRQIVTETGARLILDTPTLSAALIFARVNDSDAPEAVSLALTLQRQAPLSRCGFGIARGTICLADAPAGETPEAHGDAFARLLTIATAAHPGVILADAAIQITTAATFALRPVTATLPVFRLDPDQPQWVDRLEQAALVSEPAFVGLDQSLRRLQTALRSPGRKVTLVAVRGRPGSGRCRLASHALLDLGVLPSRIILGEPHPLAPEPYWPVLSVVRQILGFEDGPLKQTDLAESLQALAARSASGMHLRSVLKPLAALLGAEDLDDSLADSGESVALRLEITNAIRVVLEAAADQEPDRPFAVILRETDGIDLPTLQAVAQLGGSYRGAAQLIVLLCVSRQTRLPTSLAAAGLVEIEAAPLRATEAVELASSMLDQEELPPVARHLLKERGGHSPLMAALIIRYLVELGAMVHRGGAWRAATPLAASDLPRRPNDILARRIQHLPLKLASLLKAAATVGEPLSWRTLELIWVSRGFKHEEIKRSVGVLEEMGFMRREPNGTVRFSHPLVRKVAYGLQTPEERRETHRLALTAHGERYPDALRQIPAVLFRHRVESGDVAGALAAAVAAVRRAHLLHDAKRGLQLAAEALELKEPPGGGTDAVRFDLLAACEQIRDARAERDTQRTLIKQMVGLAEGLGDDRRVGLALHRAARLNLLTGDLARAAALATKALTRLQHGDPLDLSNALRTVALVRWRERDLPGAASALKQALAIYDRLGHVRGMGLVLQNLGMFALDTGALIQARRYLERALPLKQQVEDPLGTAVVLDALGQVSHLEGREDLAIPCFEQALSLREKAADVGGVGQSRVNLAQALAGERPDRAEEILRLAVLGCRSRRQRTTKIEAYLALAALLAQVGKGQEAARAAAAAARLADKTSSELLRLRVRWVRAEVELGHQGQRAAERAMVLATDAAHAALRLGAVRWRIEALSLLATAHHRLADADAATEASEALQLLKARGAPGIDRARIESRCREVLSALRPSQ
ncbi:MAG: tetratricopeptide repeat protein [Deltaproteobacteria bacterium]|nr:tetratricopeptide repeat protein [Deltaproteobacteria bacterium]